MFTEVPATLRVEQTQSLKHPPHCMQFCMKWIETFFWNLVFCNLFSGGFLQLCVVMHQFQQACIVCKVKVLFTGAWSSHNQCAYKHHPKCYNILLNKSCMFQYYQGHIWEMLLHCSFANSKTTQRMKDLRL